MDPRIQKTAKIITDYSCEIRKNDKVLIEATTEAKDLVKEIFKLSIQKGAYPRLTLGLPGLSKIYFDNASLEQLKHFPELSMHEMKNSDVFISIRSPSNTRELTNTDPKKLALRTKTLEPLNEERMKKRWLIFEFPTNAAAQEADMSLEEFENFVYSATLQDWKKISKQETKLKEILDKGKQVQILGKNTDLQFSIEGRQAIKGDGKNNLPCGELYIAPQEKSTRGYIDFSFPAIQGGRLVEGVKLEFKNGKVTKASATKNENYLKEMLKLDKGASYLGEFGIGFNYKIKPFVKNILFDEKIGGTIHLALGRAYKEGGGTNESALHWDMIKDLRNGGKLLIDGKVIQKNGKFLI